MLTVQEGVFLPAASVWYRRDMPDVEKIVTVNLNTAIDRVLEVERLEIGGHQAARRISRSPAGKAINVSRALALMNVSSIATGFVGQDELGQFDRFLESSRPGHVVSQLLAVAGATRENITVIDRLNRSDTHFREPGYELAAIDVDRIRRKVRLLAARINLIKTASDDFCALLV